MRDPVSFTAYAKGGSDEFTYSWILKGTSNNTLKTQPESDNSSFSYQFSDPGMATIECTIKDINSGKAKVFTNTFKVEIYPVNFAIFPNSFYILNASNTFKTFVHHGSGNFAYKWYLKNMSGKILSSSDNEEFATSFTEAGDMTLLCQVKDLKTNLITEVTRDFTVKVMNANLSYAYQQYMGNSADISVLITGGSENFTYSWKLIDATTNDIVKQYQGYGLCFA